MHRFRNSFWLRALFFVLALHFLNISIDTVEEGVDLEDLSLNDQEHIVEYVVESLLGYENAFAEFEDKDHNDQRKKSARKLDLIARSIDLRGLSEAGYDQSDLLVWYCTSILDKGYLQLESPPPKA